MAIDYRISNETRVVEKVVAQTENVPVMVIEGLSAPVQALIEQVLAHADDILANARKGQRANYSFRVSKHGSYAEFQGMEPVGTPDWTNVHGY